ncbi:cytochrome P450 [Conidiobolus coronatus NRRL 28638]|uniref:Cytochrome P450 n=1 Tax=Conidiobolus coronatus (strain ATCC 28846 / CBS 209.66 / NRRL 28638) TaxID=796925 RepID=A0A137NVI2_CONC2|nr:cytochrome P450 [Conidiobolus coronatus NRRL 28638]|eukprot:KXN66604.1 cytochrome P450 [Conidiobolus coronatus NRRL 28638]
MNVISDLMPNKSESILLDWRLWTSMAAVAVTGFSYWYYTFIHIPHTQGPLSKIPGEGWPLWGRVKLNWHIIAGSRPRYIHSLHRKYGPTVLIGAHMVSCTAKRDVDKIYSTYQFPKAAEYKTYNIYGGENIFSTRKREFHALRRRVITPIVANSNLDLMEEVVYKVGTLALVDNIEKKLKNTQVIDLFDVFHRSTIDAIFELFFGSGINSLKNTYLPVILTLEVGSFLLALSSVIKFISVFSDLIINLVVAFIFLQWYIKPPINGDHTVISQFLNAKDPETGKQLTWTEVAREMIVIVVGGMDTTAVTLSWTFWLMLRYPEVYKEVQKEVDEIFPNKDIAPSADTCKSSLPITEAVALESMRMYPVSGEYLPRTAPVSGTHLGGYEIPGDTLVFCSPYAYQRNPELWENPDEFDYKRWLGPNSTELKSQLMVFSQGPRGCPGRALAWTEMFLVTVSLAQRYDMKLCKGQDHLGDKPVSYFATKPRSYSLKAEFTHRSQASSS